MTDIADDKFLAGVDLARRANRNAADVLTSQGLTVDQVAIAAVYAAFDIAERLAMLGGALDSADAQARRAAGVGAIEWMRTALDEMQRQLLDGRPSHG